MRDLLGGADPLFRRTLETQKRLAGNARSRAVSAGRHMDRKVIQRSDDPEKGKERQDDGENLKQATGGGDRSLERYRFELAEVSVEEDKS